MTNETTNETPFPQSQALAEASIESLSDLFSRDPEGLTKIEFSRIIENLRVARVSWEAAEKAGQTPKAKKVSEAGRTLLATKTPDALDL
jgi:hypothetical protein